jgi:hypothetical protein
VTRIPRLCWLLPALPFAYLTVIFWLQPSDHLGYDFDQASWLDRLLYDDFDVTAYALRGLNAHAGHTPGLDTEPADDLDAALADPDWPSHADYYLEYPSATLMLFRLGWDWQPEPVAPAAVYDAHYHQIVHHLPRDEDERRLWTQFRRAGQTYLALMAVCCAALMVVLLLGYEPGGTLAGGAFLMALPAALYFGVNRFDVLPALLTACSLACLGRRWLVASAILLAAATMLKVYPVLLAPLVLRYLWPERRVALAWAAVFAATAGVIVGPPLLLWGWKAVWAPYRYQLTREGFSPRIYDYILPRVLGENDWLGQAFRLCTLALTLGLLLMRRPADLSSLLRRGAILLIVFVTLPVFYSPQWILWLLPLLAPLTRRHRSVLILAVALDFITYLTFPVIMEILGQDSRFLPESLRTSLQVVRPLLLGVVSYCRFVALGLLVLALARAERRSADLAQSRR